MKVAGRSALVTGGSRGLGRALGASLARRGARVVLTARNGEALEDAVGGIRREGGEAHGLVSDQGAKSPRRPSTTCSGRGPPSSRERASCS